MLLLLHDDDDNEVAAAEAAAPEPPADDGADGGTSRDWLLMPHSVRATATLVGDVAERPLLLRAAVIDYLAPFDAKKAAAFVRCHTEAALTRRASRDAALTIASGVRPSSALPISTEPWPST